MMKNICGPDFYLGLTALLCVRGFVYPGGARDCGIAGFHPLKMVDQSDRQADRDHIVYKLYGLTEEEIKIVEVRNL